MTRPVDNSVPPGVEIAWPISPPYGMWNDAPYFSPQEIIDEIAKAFGIPMPPPEPEPDHVIGRSSP